MTAQRSFENVAVGQQLYAILESVKKPGVLWDKLATGNYDWLGVRQNGRYVIGRPRLSPVRSNDGDAPDDRQHPHRVEYIGPLDRKPKWEAYATVEEARQAYEQLVVGDPITPSRESGVRKLRLVLDGQQEEELLVVRALPRMV
jgi:hypothetical protein